MQQTKKTRAKIFCIGSLDEAQFAIQFSASALGLVSAMHGGPGIITEDLISQSALRIPPSVSSFLLTIKKSADSIISQQRQCTTNTVQIIEQVRPFGVDVYSDVRTQGQLDERKLQIFFNQVESLNI
jgi:phosphoribosylanthranilate isomerase